MQNKLSALASRGNPAAMINPGRLQPADGLSLESAVPEGASAPLVQKQFRRILCQERKRSERSRKQFLLMLVRLSSPRLPGGADGLPHRVSAVLGKAIRDTDILGWFEADSVNGVLFSELGAVEACAASKVIEAKISSAFEMAFDANLRSKLEVHFYTFPEDRRADGYKRRIDPELYPDVFDLDEQRRTSLFIKRIIDALGSVCALILFSPIFLLLAVLIRLTSKGPVFFRQERLGQFEVPFTLLKFRSMRMATDAEIHRKYVENFIAGRAEPHVSNGNRRLVYKITNDPRITWIGRFMRRTSLDESPQFWNVLMGEMSLVGPRPPIRYELEAYEVWHRRRLLEVKPGITGLWQIHGRSRTTFDEMVRLDLRYAKMWSLLTDIKILLQTPRAVFSGDGAY
jgi:lipopolysaccharide/colanic/teichoic acid biosynthesis glycosyltransferase